MISSYWEQVRKLYGAFESDIRAGASEVYVHGMPGGQYTNLREQARALGIEEARWPEVAQAYVTVNEMFGNIIKVTPTSKTVGDLALHMITSALTREEVLDPESQIAFPESVVQLFHGGMGQPLGGFPHALQRKMTEGHAAAHRTPGGDIAARWTWKPSAPRSARNCRDRSRMRISPPTSCIRACGSTTHISAFSMATSRSCRRRCSSMGWSPVMKSA